MNDSFNLKIFPDGRLLAKDAAKYLGLTEKTLAQKRSKGTGPRFVKLGRIFYYKADLDAWLSAGVFSSTAQSRLKCF